MIAAGVLFGPAGGALAGTIAGPYTQLLWGHPWGWLLLIGLGALTGSLSRSHLPVPATALGWIVAGPAMFAGMVLLAPGYPTGTAATVVAKSVLEWMLGALLVQVALLGPFVRRLVLSWLPPPLAEVRTKAALLSIFALGGALPLLVLGYLGSRLLYQSQVEGLDRQLFAEVTQLRVGIRASFAETMGKVAGAATAVDAGSGSRDPLDRVVAGLDAATVATLEDGSGRMVGVSATGDEEAALRLIRAGRALFPGRLAGPALGQLEGAVGALVVAAPVPRGGRLLVEMDPRRFLRPVERFVPAPLEVLVLDRHGMPIVGTLPARDAVAAARDATPGEVTTFLPTPGSVRTLRPQSTVRLVVAEFEPLRWRIVILARQAVLQTEIEKGGLALLLGALVALGVGALAAVALSRTVIRPVEAVSEAATRIAAGERSARAGPAAGTATREVRQLGARFDEMAAALAQQLEETERASRVKDEFLTIASHELKTPITTLKAQLQLLQRQMAASGADTERFRVLVRQVDRLSRLVAQVLDASRLSSGRLDLELSRFDLAELVRRVGAEVVAASPLHELLLEAEPAVGCWDEVRVEQVFQNLIGNACKYSPHGGPVEIRVSAVDGWAVVEVADRGIGISADEANALFGRFVRGSAGSANEIAGLGVGLFVSAEIVRCHGGSITLRPREGGGAVAIVSLPLEPPA